MNKEILAISPICGGDINEAYKVSFANGEFAFLKSNSSADGFKMLQAESRGLYTIASTGSIRIPKILKFGQYENQAFLLLEFIAETAPTSGFWQVFGKQLADLHKTSNTHFGNDEHNFIGSLRQDNTIHSNWIDFFIQCRIEPQLRMAQDRNLLGKSDMILFDFLTQSGDGLFPKEIPSLLHGDLWSGNFLISSEYPILIDPACYYGHREMDLAMTKLFGGFNQIFYDSYTEEFPLSAGWKDRVKLYQLYPLLVHLNLFGRSYLPSIKRITQVYS